MKGNLYGVDIKLNPDNKPCLIEVNGQGSGTRGFRIAYGDLRTQKEILSALNHFGEGRPIYRKHNNDKRRFSPRKLCLTALCKAGTLLNDVVNKPLLDLRQEWIKEPYETDHKREDSELPEEDYQVAAQELGIDFRPHSALKLINPRALRVKHPSGEYDEIHPGDVGVIWGGNKVFSKTHEFDDVLINPYVTEALLGIKLYVHRLLEDTTLHEHIPISVPYGMGLLHDLPGEIMSGDKVVYKPNAGGGGPRC
ncbi:MAG: hypothetical protein ABIJ20_00630 [Nanoarchaeota archaeon]